MAESSLDQVLDRFDAALGARPIPFDSLIDGFRALTIPTGVTDAQLSRVVSVCCRLLDAEAKATGGDLEAAQQRQHLSACAYDQMMRILRDPDAQTRRWIVTMQDRHRARGQPIPDDLNANQLPPPFEIPWDRATAKARLQPFFRHFEAILADDPCAHFKMGWDVSREGRQVVRPIIAEWMHGLDNRGIGLPGTTEAIERALELNARAERPVTQQPEWDDIEQEIVPLLTHPHPMIAAGAARYLGSLYAEADFRSSPSTLPIDVELEQLRMLGRHRAVVAGAFVCGFDQHLEGLHALANDEELAAAGFNLDSWVLDILTHGEEAPPYLPNAQALWFYVHEHYCANPRFVMKLIDIGRLWIAVMCATELHEPVDGMRAVLERLVEEGAARNAEWVDGARRHLARVYR